MFLATDIPRLLPELMLIVLAVLVVSSDVLARWGHDGDSLRMRAAEAAQLTRAGLGIALAITLIQSRLLFSAPELSGNGALDFFIGLLRNIQAAGPGGPPVLGAFAIDNVTMLARLLLIGAALLVTLLLPAERPLAHPAELYGMLLFATAGMCVMAGAQELILAYIALELSSLALYVLAGYLRTSPLSAEAGMKYFLFGALSSAVLLYGLSLAYGFTAQSASQQGRNVITTLFSSIAAQLQGAAPATPLPLLAAVLIVAGLSYKIAAVPFHSWAPDVYQGAPAPMTALIATASKAAGFLLVYRILVVALPGLAGSPALSRLGGWGGLVALIALLSLILGNVTALPQTNLRRLLAYSGIGHTGFMLLALPLAAAARPDERALATAALMYYLAAYVTTNLVTFGALAVMDDAIAGGNLADLRALWRRRPTLAVLLTLGLLSLAGIPPLAGFWAKLGVFLVAYRAGAIWLLVIALAMTVVSLAYYLRVVRIIWSSEPAPGGPIAVEPRQIAGVAIAAALMFALSFAPGAVWSALEQTVQLAVTR
jgi:NADH-quinone oxidoreductase subunit N